MEPDYPIKGIHHITLVSGDAGESVRFYAETLGMRFVKKTVDFDNPNTYHLYFGDDTGTPGTLVTIYGWPEADNGLIGVGMARHFALTVESRDGLLKWKTYLQDQGVPVAGPYQHPAYANIVFLDPDGIELELATREPGWTKRESADDVYLPPLEERAPFWDIDAIEAQRWPHAVVEIEPDMRIQGLHHIGCMASDLAKTDQFYQETLGIPRLFKTVDEGAPTMPRWFWSADGGRPGSTVTYVALPADAKPVTGKVGKGTVHHFAFEVESGDAQRYWHDRLRERGVELTPLLNRKYFRSFYFKDPDGVTLEIATGEPGFLVDEPKDGLGQKLALPDWLEPRRREIESALPPIGAEAPVQSS